MGVWISVAGTTSPSPAARTGRCVVLAHGFGCDQNMWRLVRARPWRETLPGGAVRLRRARAGRTCRRGTSERYSTLDGYAEDVVEVCEELDLRDGDVRRALGQRDDRRAGRGAGAGAVRRLVMLAPSPCYLDDDDYRGGFSARTSTSCWSRWSRNYLGWSAAMAPVIMGNPDRPELGEELTNSFCAHRPGHRPGLRPHDVPVRQPRRSDRR